MRTGYALPCLLTVFLVLSACCLDMGRYQQSALSDSDTGEVKTAEAEAKSLPSVDYYASKIDDAMAGRDFDKALLYSNEGLVQFPGNDHLKKRKAETLVSLANESLNSYNYGEAIGYAEMGLKIEDDYHLYWLKFLAERKTSDYESALDTCSNALKIFPEDLRFTSGRAATQAKLGDHTSALETVESALSSYPDDEGLLELKEIILEAIPCSDDDGFCPRACNAFTDNDCEMYAVGETAVVDENLALTLLSEPAPERHECWTRYDSKQLADTFWGFAFRTKMMAENRGNTTSENVGYYSFNLIAADGNRYETTEYLSGTCAEYASEIFKMQDIPPNTTVEKEVWFSLGKSSIPPKPYYIVWDPSGWTSGEEVIWEVH